jgi:hypothetical protein
MGMGLVEEDDDWHAGRLLRPEAMSRSTPSASERMWHRRY